MSKNALNNFDYDAYYKLLTDAENDQVFVLHMFDRDFAWGGCTVAWKRTGYDGRGDMIQLSITHCSEREQFCRKIGTANALFNFYDGQTILMPLNNEDSAVVVENIRQVFQRHNWF